MVGIDRKNGHKFLSFQELSARERGGKATLISLDRIKVYTRLYLISNATAMYLFAIAFEVWLV